MSGPQQTVNFLPPSYITTLTTTVTSLSGSVASLNSTTVSLSGSVASLNATTVSLSGSVGILQQNVTAISVTGSFNAQSNCTYQYNLAWKKSGSATITCTLPSSPADGAKIVLIDGKNTNGWGNIYYSCRVSAAAPISGDAFALVGSYADLFKYRGKMMTFVYNASSASWISQASNNTNPLDGNNLNKSDDPLTGWWQCLTKFTGILDLAPPILWGTYAYIDATRYPIRYQLYDGNTPDRVYNNPVSTCTFYEYTGSSSSNLYTKTYMSILGSSLIGGPEAAFDDWWPVQIWFPGTTFDFINITTNMSAINAAYDQGELVGVYKRINAPNGNSQLKLKQITAGGEFLDTNPSDPITMFNYIVDTVEQNCGDTNSNAVTYAPDYYTRRQLVDDMLSPLGATFSVPVCQVRKSHVFTGANLWPSLNASYTGGSTQLTDICCAFSQYNTPGSNVTLSGFTNDWSVLNNTFTNGVSAHAWSMCKENNTRQDLNYANGLFDKNSRVFTNTSVTGSCQYFANRFMLLADTSSAISSTYLVTTGPFKNYGVNFGTPTVTVTHRVYRNMPYNEFHAAYAAVINYCYPGKNHFQLRSYYSNPQGQLVSAWNFSSSASVVGQARTRSSWGSYAPQSSLNGNIAFWGSAGSAPLSQLYTLMNQEGEINNPYQLTDFINNYIRCNNSIPDGNCNMIPFFNYCETGTLFNLYYAWSGTKASPSTNAGIIQSYFSDWSGKTNLNNPAEIGGSYFVGGLFPFVSPFLTGAYSQLYTNPTTGPDLDIWIPGFGGGVDNNKSTSAFAVGKVRSELCGGKSVFYMRIKNMSEWPLSKIYEGCTQFAALASPGFTGPASLRNNPGFGGWTSDWSALSAVTKWMNSFGTGPNAIIIDIRNSGGGGYYKPLLSMFGGDRAQYFPNHVWKDDGYSAKLVNVYGQTGANAFWTPAHTGSLTFGNPVNTNLLDNQTYNESFRPSLVAANFGQNAVIKNCNLVCLNDTAAASASELFATCLFGDQGDRNLGAGVRSSLIGSRTSANLGIYSSNPTVFGNGVRPVNSRRMNVALPFTLDSGYNGNFVLNVTGPLANNLLSENLSYNTINAATGPDNLGGTSGNGALISDCSILAYDLGFLAPPSGSYYISQSRALPSTSDPSTWRDAWMEQAIRQAQYM